MGEGARDQVTPLKSATDLVINHEDAISSYVKLLIKVLLGIGRGLHSPDDFQKSNENFLVPNYIFGKIFMNTSRIPVLGWVYAIWIVYGENYAKIHVIQRPNLGIQKFSTGTLPPFMSVMKIHSN